jgi:hypothetical protein
MGPSAPVEFDLQSDIEQGKVILAVQAGLICFGATTRAL